MVSLLEAQGNSKHIFESLHLTLYMFLYYIVKHENFRCANFSRIVMCETSEFILPDMWPPNSLDLIILMNTRYGDQCNNDQKRIHDVTELK